MIGKTSRRLPLTVSRIMRAGSLLALLLAVVVLWSLVTGAAGRGFFSGMKDLLTGSMDASEETIIYAIRLPRALMAMIIGAALSSAGVVFQALLRNPLADPYVLGVSGGSATGAIIGILIGAGSIPFGITGLAFLGGLITIFLVLGIAEKRREIQSHTLLLAGVIINAFFSAVILFLVSTSSNSELRNIMFWLMGDLGAAESSLLLIAGVVLLGGLFFVYLHARDMNLLTLGEESAMQLGVNVARVKTSLLIVASLLTALAVSLSGVIGFVGLVIPHSMRLMLGSDHRLLLPSSLLFGAAFLLAADTMARTILAPSELPVGVITALLGAPFFVYLLRNKVVSKW